MRKSREIWVDNIKVFACILVTLGHFFQSMTNSHIIETSQLTLWFNSTIYYIHVPLFFLCSGYVYQKYSRINSLVVWKNNVLKKAITLGVPYFVFSLVTWVLKYVFSGSMNIENRGLFETLFVVPVAPYWFLYILFFLFVLIPTFRNRRMMMVGVGVALVCKLISTLVEIPGYIISKVCINGIWFVAGMVLAQTNVIEKCRSRKWFVSGCITAAAFLMLSVFVYDKATTRSLPGFMMGILGCMATVLIIGCVFTGKEQNPVWEFMARYTMPVFLMHTIFAAGWRSVLMKLGVSNAAVHIVSGLVISFVAPFIAAKLMQKVKVLDFVINPAKYIRIKTR